MLYKCVRSGRTMEVTNPDDIIQMKTNESYIALEPYPVAPESTAEVSTHSQGEQDGLRKKAQEVPVQNADAPPQVKKRGSPARVQQVVEQPAAAEQDWV